jgi:hypothetical protein
MDGVVSLRLTPRAIPDPEQKLALAGRGILGELGEGTGTTEVRLPIARTTML